MKTQVQDERIIQEYRNQNNSAFGILYLGVLLDLLYRQFILLDPISRYWDLALLFFGVSIYLATKRVNSGLLATKPNIKLILPTSVVATVVILITNYYFLGNTSPVDLILGCITFFVVFCGINLLMQYISSKKNDAMLKDE